MMSAATSPAAAQAVTSREVVQALPSQDVQRLNRALMRLAKRPRSIDALLEAGDAALAVDDLDAALGFYSRADDISPDNADIKLGMARVFLRSGRPLEAIPLFAAAQAAGAEPKELLSDRALAYDLVGDQPSAQAAYRRAVREEPEDDEAKRRLAISLAISGDREEFERTLRPLIDKRDFAAFRARAFGLAILGDHARASAIAGAVMPRDLALRIDPYFEFMPRLTKSQQAAAANLGIFPGAADIGRDDPQLAAYVGNAATLSATADARASARAPDRRLEPAGAPLGRTTSAAAEVPAASVASARPTAQPGFDLAGAGRPAADAAATRTVPLPPAPASVASPEVSVADAFADLGTAAPVAVRPSGQAVDLAAINIPREKPPAPAKPSPPAHPSRIWVQLATGRDVDALRFDWRRFSRKAPALLGDLTAHVTPWGEANRLLVGPLKSRDAQRELINALNEQGIDTFGYVSPEGTEIKPIK